MTWLTRREREPAVEVPPNPTESDFRDDPRGSESEPQGLKPTSLAALRGTAESRALPKAVFTNAIYETESLPESSGASGNAKALPFLFSSPAKLAFPITGSHKPKLLYLAIALGVLALAIAAAVFSRRALAVSAAVPVRVGFNLNSVRAFDNENRVLWTHAFSQNLDSDALFQYRFLADRAKIGDFRGNGEHDVLVAVPFSELTPDGRHSEVDLFSAQGRLLWSYVPTFKFQFGKHPIGGFWVVMDLLVSPVDHGNVIWATFQDGVWGNSFVVSIEPHTGKETLRFVNTGTTHVLGEVGDETRFLVAGGFNNESDLGSVSIIDETRTFAASPQTPGSRHECVSCPAGVPDYYFVFPRSEINELQGFHDDGVTDLHIIGTQIEAIKGGVVKDDPARVHYIFRADKAFRPVALRFNSGYDAMHRQLEHEGKLHHTLENCPERSHPRPIRMWTPSDGWTTIQLDPAPYNH